MDDAEVRLFAGHVAAGWDRWRRGWPLLPGQDAYYDAMRDWGLAAERRLLAQIRGDQ